jgi:hypothetical protein
VAGVQFLLDGAPLGSEDMAAPYSVAWNTTGTANGSHTLTARARDAAGNQATSAAVTVTINNDTTGPTVGVTAPSSGATVAGTVTVSATASDNVGVAGVQFLLDGAPLGSEDTVSPYSIAWNTTATVNGSHTLAARARDAAGNLTTSAGVSVTIGNASAPAGLVLGLGFEEGAGSTTADVSGMGHTATLSGAAWTTAGRFGNALSFDGTNDLLTVGDTAVLRLTTNLTLEAWVRPTSVFSWRTVLIKERTGGLAYALYGSDDSSRPAGYVRLGTDVGIAGPTSIATNTWTHLALTYDGVTLRLYVNGAQVRSQALTGSIATSTSPLRIGGNNVWGEFFAGLIDEVRIYNRALSAAEIQSDMQTPVGGGS